MKQASEQLYSEIADISAQYRQEVPSGRRAWPESIKSRVLALRKAGIRGAEISRRTGLPYYTVLQWREKSPSFVELPVVVAPQKVSTVTVPASSALSILLPSGARIEGLDLRSLTALLPALGVGL